MVESVLTPPHPNPFEALLDEPPAGTFPPPTTQRETESFVHGRVDVIPVWVGTTPFPLVSAGLPVSVPATGRNSPIMPSTPRAQG